MVDDPPTISVAVGITVGLLASFVQSAGLTLQRKSHLINESLPEGQKKPERRRPLWLLGFTIFITSNILGAVFQIASLPVVILAPLGAVSLLWNAVFAKLLLGDAFSHFMAIGTLFIAGGAVLIAVFGILPEPTRSLEDLLKLFQREAFIIYFSLLGAVLGVVLLVTHIVEARLPVDYTYESPPLEPVPLPGAGTGDRPIHLEEPSANATTATTTTERTPLLMDNKSTTSLPHPSSTRTSKAIQMTKLWIAISYASASGILSGMCLLFAKSGVELLLLTFTTPQNQFTHWQSWLLLLGLVGFAVLQLWYLHKSLVLADPTLVCPLAFCFYNLSSIFNGLVYYDQFALMSPLKLGMVGLGMVILLAGVWAVSVQGGNDEEGGTRVEVGTWTEGAEVIGSEIIGVESAAITGGVGVEPPPPTVTLTGVSDSRRGRTGLLLSTENLDSDLEREESVSPLRRVSSPAGSPSAHHHHHHHGGPTPFPIVRSPTGRYGDVVVGHARDPSGTTRHRRMWSAIFEGQGGVAPGLSIGLGATSPGFALVPRRRVSSGMSGMSGYGSVGASAGGGGGGGGGSVSPGVVRRTTSTSVGDVEGGRGRRTVSEGDFGRLRDAEGRPLLGGGPGGGPREAASASGANSGSGEDVPRRGWDWVRKVFRL